MAVVTIGERGEIVLPPELIAELGLKPGDTVDVVVRPADEFPLTDEPIGPETEAGIREGLQDLRKGNVGPRLRTKEEIREYFARLRKS